jgi:enoyl-CoA hydratase/carnithine racemase
MSEIRIGEFVRVTRDGAIATVTMDRGDGRNALSRQPILEMTEAARGFAGDLETQAVIRHRPGRVHGPEPTSRSGDGSKARSRPSRASPTDHASARTCATRGKRSEQVTICAIGEILHRRRRGVLAAACDFSYLRQRLHMRAPRIRSA